MPGLYNWDSNAQVVRPYELMDGGNDPTPAANHKTAMSLILFNMLLCCQQIKAAERAASSGHTQPELIRNAVLKLKRAGYDSLVCPVVVH